MGKCPMRSVLSMPMLKLASVFCVLILLMTTLQVATGAVADDAVEGPAYDMDTMWVPLKQLTISNDEAVLPSAASTLSSIHVTWADVSDEGMELRWKRSDDSGRIFTADRPISPRFALIENIQIVCSDDDGIVAVVFSARSTADGDAAIHIVASADGGANWTQAHSVAPGRQAAVSLFNGSIYLGVFSSTGGMSVFSIIQLDVDGTSLTASGTLLSMQAPESMVKMLSGPGGIDFSLALGPGPRHIIYGRVGYDSTLTVQPTAVWTVSGVISDMELGTINGCLSMMIGANDGTSFSLMHGDMVGDPTAWRFYELLRSEGSIGDLSWSVSPDEDVIAWEESKDGSPSIAVSTMSNGLLGDPRVISGPGTAASHPSLVRNDVDVISCIFASSDWSKSEAYLARDLEFVTPDIVRLIDWMDQRDPAVFHGGERSRSSAVERLVGIADSFYAKNVPEAHRQIADLQNELDGAGTDDLTFNILYPEAFNVEAKLDANLGHLLIDGVPSLDGYVPMAMQQSAALENPLFANIKAITNPSSRTVTISWHTTADSPTGNYVYYGKPTERVAVGGPNSTFHSVTLAGLPRDRGFYYYVMSGSSRSQTYSFLMNVRIESTSTMPEFNTSTVSWTTNSNCVCTIEYGNTTSYGSSAMVTSSEDGTSHDSVLECLSEGTTYYYRIRAEFYQSSSFYHVQTGSFITYSLSIRDVEVDVGLTAANISWSTGLGSTCTLDYGTSPSLGMSATVSSTVDMLTHSVSLTQLTEDATYFFRIGADRTALPSRHIEHSSTFWTLAIVITNATASSPETAKVAGTIEFEWDTNRASTGQVQYGTSPGALTGVANGSLATHHHVRLEGLQPGIVYYYRMVSSIPADVTKNAVHEGSIMVNIIHGLVARTGFSDGRNGIETTVTISWFTAVDVRDSFVYFGDGVTSEQIWAYGHSGYMSAEIDGWNGNSLPADIDYVYWLYHRTYAGVVFNSPAYSVVTNVTLFNLEANPSSNEAILSLASGRDCTVYIDYGLTTAYGRTGVVSSVPGGVPGMPSAYDLAQFTTHLSGLDFDTLYYYRVWVEHSRFPQFYTVYDGSFRTAVMGIEDLTTWSTADSIIISWTTNRAATTQVGYRTSADGPMMLATGEHGTEHIIAISGLSQNTQYTFVVSSAAIDGSNVSCERSGSSTTQPSSVYDFDILFLENQTAVVSWRTNFIGSSVVKVQGGGQYETYSYFIGTNGLEHTVMLPGLNAGRNYRCWIYSVPEVDASANVTDGVAHKFRATLSISNISVVFTSLTSVRISWTTDHLSTSIVGLDRRASTSIITNPYPRDEYGLYNGPSGVREHYVEISGLRTSTTYYFQVRSDWNGVIATSGCYSFTISQLTIGSVSVSGLDHTSVTIHLMRPVSFRSPHAFRRMLNRSGRRVDM